MEFTKMNGLGNDFIVVFGEKDLPIGVDKLAVDLCNRYFGIGADGLVYILPSERADFRMRIINSDGSEAEQCGNAIRCVAKFVFDNGHTDKQWLTIETLGAGVQQVELTVEDGKAAFIRVDMGEPILEGLRVPTTIDAERIVAHPIEVDGREFSFTAVSMGNPHAVIYVDDAAGFDLAAWGPKLETHPMFPRKTNVEFVTVNSRNHTDMRVWERGAGPTLACGTGACATVVSSVLNGLTDREVTVSLKGGDLLIEWSEVDNHVYMTGPAAEVFRGKL
ncbi:diaminopimelate epimerase [Paenibacillus herberti]|uniref:Diaminopimelate epimerase n=1 Tax=Paenibacillus herberti TaxID=1619309 RepID=A0A229P0X6_9BACL|nr:diaminopimelate epimerase [Paenibacillus herberti]OXM15842.1 diaminopimelate epimerase [Paenibacillus herberti]